MNREEIIERIKGFLSEEFEVPVEKIQDDAPLKETLDLDSLDYVDLVVIIEENFGFKVAQNDFKDLNSFADFYAYVEQKIQ